MEKPAKTDHPIHELLSARWSPRAFSGKPVDRATLCSLLEAARWAPSCYNEQPWSFLLATKAEPEAFERMLSCLTPGNQRWARNAPALILTVARLAFERNGRPNRHAFHDVGLAAASLVFQATALGLRVHQMAGIVPDKIRETYRVPEGHEPLAGIALGYPGSPDGLPEDLRERELAPRWRKPLKGFVFSGSWGAPAPHLR